MVPVAGSAYTYAYATLGELFAWIIGWDLVLEYAVASSTVAHGWSHYLLQLLSIFGVTLPERWTNSPIDVTEAYRFFVTDSYCNLPGALIVLLVTVVLVICIRESAGFNSAMVILKRAIVLFVIGVGVAYVWAQNWHPFLP